MRDILVKLRYMYSYYIIQCCTIQLGKKKKKNEKRERGVSYYVVIALKVIRLVYIHFHCFSSLLNLFVFLCPTKTARVT